MLRYELFQLLHNKKKMLMIILFVFIICFDAFLAYRSSFLCEYMQNPYYDLNMVYLNTDTPSTAAFLSGSSQGHIPQEIIFWLLPFYFLFINADLHAQEVKFNNFQLLKVRKSYNHIFFSKLSFSFLVGFLIMLISLLLNFIICLFVFKNGLNQNASASDLVWFLSDQYPNLAYVCYMFLVSIIVGVFNSAMTGLSFVLEQKIPLYILSFVIWYLQITSEYSLMYVVQPFIEYGSKYLITALIIFFISSLVIILIGYMKGKYNDIH